MSDTTEIVTVQEQRLEAFRYEDWAVKIERPPTFEEWQMATQSFITVWRRSLAIIGDLLNIGERLFGEAYAQVFSLDLDDYARQSLYNAKSICKSVRPEVRQLAPSFSHCAEVAPLPEQEQRDYLTMATEQEMTKQELRERIAIDKGRPLPSVYQCEAELVTNDGELCFAPDPSTERGALPIGRVKLIIRPA